MEQPAVLYGRGRFPPGEQAGYVPVDIFFQGIAAFRRKDPRRHGDPFFTVTQFFAIPGSQKDFSPVIDLGDAPCGGKKGIGHFKLFRISAQHFVHAVDVMVFSKDKQFVGILVYKIV